MSSIPFHINNPNNIISDSLTTSILKNSRALSFHSSLPFYAPTPIIHLTELAEKFEVGNIYIKDESFRFGLNAFKGLGASYAIHKILEHQPHITTFCTATDGNHGRAVAWSAKLYDKKSVVFVPKDTTKFRMDAIIKEGAIVEKINGNYDETCAFAEQKSKKEGWQYVQDTAWENYEEIPAQIMAGYLTHFQEIENSVHTLPNAKIDIVFLQAGVGSWAGAAGWYYLNRYGINRPKIVIVEPYESSGIMESFQQGFRTAPKGNFQTIMAGLNCGIPSLNAWEILKDTVDVVMKIEDRYAKQAMRMLYFTKKEDQRITAGESGAGGLAGFIALMTDPRFKDLRNVLNITKQSNILFYSTEGATDPASFQSIINEE